MATIPEEILYNIASSLGTTESKVQESSVQTKLCLYDKISLSIFVSDVRVILSIIWWSFSRENFVERIFSESLRGETRISSLPLYSIALQCALFLLFVSLKTEFWILQSEGGQLEDCSLKYDPSLWEEDVWWSISSFWIHFLLMDCLENSEGPGIFESPSDGGILLEFIHWKLIHKKVNSWH